MKGKQKKKAAAAARRPEGHKEVLVSRQVIWQKIRRREGDVELLRREAENIRTSADQALEKGEEILERLARVLEERRSELRPRIRSEVGRVGELREKMEEEILDLERLLGSSAEAPPPRFGSVGSSPGSFFRGLRDALTDARDGLLLLLEERWRNISRTVDQADVLLSRREPASRAELLKHHLRLTLDADTADWRLVVSEGDREATAVRKEQAFSRHPDRFFLSRQVLSRELLSGRCYWEVDWAGDEVVLAVAYENIAREGDECGFGWNAESWALSWSHGAFGFRHDKVPSAVAGERASRLGVFLHHGAGVLCFYGISDAFVLLRRVQTTFTGPLRAGLGLYSSGSKAELVKH